MGKQAKDSNPAHKRRKKDNYLTHKQKMSRGKYLATTSERERTELLVCRLGVVASHHSLFPVSYRWRAESDYKGCHPSGPPATCRRDTNRKREHSCSVYTSGGRSLAVRVQYSEVIKAPDIGGRGKSAGGGSLTAPQMETQSSRVLRKLLGSNGCQ